MLGETRLEKTLIEAILLDGIEHKDNRRYHLRVMVERQDGEYKARLTGDQGLGILSSMVRAHGLAIIPEDTIICLLG